MKKKTGKIANFGINKKKNQKGFKLFSFYYLNKIKQDCLRSVNIRRYLLDEKQL